MIYTSYFSSKKYNKEDGISISRYCKFWDGEAYPLLYPSASLLAWWKGLSKEAQSKQEFQDTYWQYYWLEVLSKLDPDKIAKELDEKVLLCYEKATDFCHRHLVAKWLRGFGYEVKEL